MLSLSTHDGFQLVVNVARAFAPTSFVVRKLIERVDKQSRNNDQMLSYPVIDTNTRMRMPLQQGEFGVIIRVVDSRK